MIQPDDPPAPSGPMYDPTTGQPVVHTPAVGPTGRANPHPFARSFAAAGAVVVVMAVLILAFVGTPKTAEAFGAFVGRLAFPGILAALVTGLIARRSQRVWSWGKHIAIVAGITVLLIVLTVGSRAGA